MIPPIGPYGGLKALNTIVWLGDHVLSPCGSWRRWAPEASERRHGPFIKGTSTAHQDSPRLASSDNTEQASCLQPGLLSQCWGPPGERHPPPPLRMHASRGHKALCPGILHSLCAECLCSPGCPHLAGLWDPSRGLALCPCRQPQSEPHLQGTSGHTILLSLLSL